MAGNWSVEFNNCNSNNGFKLGREPGEGLMAVVRESILVNSAAEKNQTNFRSKEG